jgi:glycosyltransferase involved in cell wall biosynthesis
MATVISMIPYPFLPANNGGQKGIALFNQYFSQHVRLIGITVEQNDNTLAGYNTIPLFSASRLRYINPFYIHRICRIIRKEKASHLMIEHPYMGWMALIITMLTGIKLIVHSHNIEALRFKTTGKWWWKVLWLYEGFIHRKADNSFFISDADRDYAIKHYHISTANSLVATFGIEWDQPPSEEERKIAAWNVRQKHNISPEEQLLLFVGAFKYPPNFEAYCIIRDKICPALNDIGMRYKMLICGGGLEKEQPSDPNIIIAGFVDDIHLYFKAADVFVNPVLDGGGIKTKVVEALGNNLSVVSTFNGSIGIDKNICGGKLTIVEEDDWALFAHQIREATIRQSHIPVEFFQHFNWKYITAKAAKIVISDAQPDKD